MDYFLAFLIGLVPSFLGNIAGGGGGLIVIPALIGLGLSPIEAIATSKFGAIGFITGSVISGQARKLIRYDHIKPLLVLTIFSSIAGPLLATHLPQTQVKALVGFFIITTAIISLLSFRMSSHAKQINSWSRYFGYFLFFIVSIVLAGFGSGTMLLVNYILIGLVGFSVLETISTSRILGIVSVPIQVIFFAHSGHIKYGLGVTFGLGSLIGAYYGLHYAIKKGNDFVKKVMAVASIALVISIFI